MSTPTGASRCAPLSPILRLAVMGEFAMTRDGAALTVPVIVQRVVAFLAVRRAPQRRSTIASTLWMDTSDGQAAARLRAALWRAEKVAPGWIAKRGQLVELSADVDVDLDRAMALGLQLTAEPSEPVDVGADIEPLTYDLLPYWEEDWLLFERERVRQLRVHALESLCRQLVECGQLAQAIDAGLAAVASEPLRESAHRALIAAHLAEGNVSEARRQYQLYRAVLDDQLGLTPSPLLRELVFGASAKPA